MIVTTQLIWLHIPKTAGTTTDALFKASGIPLLWQDSQQSPRKHLPPEEHPEANHLAQAAKCRVANFRRLPYWLLSNLQHKHRLMGLQLEEDPIREGLFWREREQQWLKADWWLERFEITPDWPLIRVETLKIDFLRILSEHESLPRWRRLRVRLVADRNQNHYSRDIREWFSYDDLNSIYKANPRWSELEKKNYGRLLNEL